MKEYRTGLDTIISDLEYEKNRRVKALNSGQFCDNTTISKNIYIIDNAIKLIKLKLEDK